MATKRQMSARYEEMAEAVQRAQVTPDNIEVSAISLLVTILSRLRWAERRRVLRYLLDRFNETSLMHDSQPPDVAPDEPQDEGY